MGGPLTMVLMGRTGNGKSATGNRILGRKAFKSLVSSGGVTSTTECQSTNLKDGRLVNVIDTPGLFDYHVGSEHISQEIVKCIGLAGDGIHAVLLVLSIRGRFTEEEETVIRTLQTFFGPKITEYMIVVFTGGDDLEEDESLEAYLSRCCPKPQQKVLQVCKNRCVLFDNKTADEKKKESQLQKLITLIENVIGENGGQPYTDNFFAEYKRAAILQKKKEEANASKVHTEEEVKELTEQMKKSHDEQLKLVTKMVEEKLNVTNDMLMKQLAAEKLARVRAEKAACDAWKKSVSDANKVTNDPYGLMNQLVAVNSARVKAEKAAFDARKKAEDDAKNELLMKQLAAEKAARAEANGLLMRQLAAEKAARAEANGLLMRQSAAEKAARAEAEKAACDARKKAEDDAKTAKQWMDRAHAAEGRPQVCSIM